MSNEIDPMLSDDAQVRADYRKGVNQRVKELIEEDRVERKQKSGTSESQATVMGVSGLNSGLFQSTD